MSRDVRRAAPSETSSDRLAAALDANDYTALAARARRHEFHDFRSEHAMPQHKLVEELRAIPGGGVRAEGIVRRVMNGEFDATKEESDEWLASSDGQRAMKDLLG